METAIAKLHKFQEVNESFTYGFLLSKTMKIRDYPKMGKALLFLLEIPDSGTACMAKHTTSNE